jgi:hypothetical protein
MGCRQSLACWTQATMRSIPLQEREKAFGLLQAREAFKQCIRISAYAINSNIGPKHELFLPMAVTAHVIYARPFLQSYGFGKLEDAIVPARYKETHKRVLEFRHKVFAHRQLKERRRGEKKATLLDYHSVYLVIRGNQAFTTVAEQHPGPNCFRDIYVLSYALLEKVRYHSQKFFKRYMRLLPKEDGTYKLLVEDDAEISFTRVDDIDSQEHTFSANLPVIQSDRD